ncbi:hypothetical protein IscW_ISCW005384 [Ixodes scapularis]|uniref:Aminopeptidase N-like N-terminal domain-containing protein n=1 Tax=Ixodes scapularis TaxID=6945 RepID=B7PQN2_IXOSC|nr:hypothetical protein IscW_ISCW005384 [Ixodes scapularis]|eukprot:XP_002436074.1 hypothetical protein IscW_ISCW005384 [Ixodes scapularis]
MTRSRRRHEDPLRRRRRRPGARPSPVDLAASAPLEDHDDDDAGRRLSPSPTLGCRRTVLPLSYDLTLEPRLEADTFEGEVWITVNATIPVDRFVVHVFRLTVDETEVFSADGMPLVTSAPVADDLNEFFVVPVASGAGPVAAGVYKLRFKFRGSLVGGIVGFYKSRYKIGNETRVLDTGSPRVYVGFRPLGPDGSLPMTYSELDARWETTQGSYSPRGSERDIFDALTTSL